jgi:TldD protein
MQLWSIHLRGAITPHAFPVAMTFSTRREFLTTSSLSMLGAIVGARAAGAASVRTLPARSSWCANDWLHAASVMSPDELRTLATHGVDAATRAGASYADVRIGEQYRLVPRMILPAQDVNLYTECAYGIRARVGGSWGFAYGRALTPDAVARCARDAVTAARVADRISAPNQAAVRAAERADMWTPPPSVTGTWRTPIEIDPFTVPLQHHGEMMLSLHRAAARVSHGMAVFTTEWQRDRRVFAASTGSLTFQDRYAVDFDFNFCNVVVGNSHIPIRLPEWHTSSMGFEVLSRPGALERIKLAAEEALPLARLPIGRLDVGRYPVVFDGVTMGGTIAQLFGPSLELDRVLGEEAGTSGRSLLALDQLGTPIVSPLMTVTGHRAAPSIAAAQWDDEGTVTTPHVVIKDGVLVDYHTTGQTVGALEQWYASEKRPLQSNGCAVAPDAHQAVYARAPHLTMEPSRATQSLDDLCKSMSHGVLVRYKDAVQTDQQQATATWYGTWDPEYAQFVQGVMYEVARGKIVRRLLSNILQARTFPFFKGLTAVGDATTVHDQTVPVYKGMPWQKSIAGASAPAALFKEVDVLAEVRN